MYVYLLSLYLVRLCPRQDDQQNICTGLRRTEQNTGKRGTTQNFISLDYQLQSDHFSTNLHCNVAHLIWDLESPGLGNPLFGRSEVGADLEITKPSWGRFGKQWKILETWL